MNIATHTPHNNIDVVGFFAANNVLFFLVHEKPIYTLAGS